MTALKIDADIAAMDGALDAMRGRLTDRRRAVVEACASEEAVDRDDPAMLLDKARAIYDGRRARDGVFAGLDLFAEPAWDILLDLFAARLSGGSASEASACIASMVPAPTALRWIDLLERDGLLSRTSGIDGGGREAIGLTDRGFGLVARAVARS